MGVRRKPRILLQYVGAVVAKVNNLVYLKPSEYQMESLSRVAPANCSALALSIEAPEKENVISPDPSIAEVGERR